MRTVILFVLICVFAAEAASTLMTENTFTKEYVTQQFTETSHEDQGESLSPTLPERDEVSELHSEPVPLIAFGGAGGKPLRTYINPFSYIFLTAHTKANLKILDNLYGSYGGLPFRI